MTLLQKQIEELNTYIKDKDHRNTNVSQVTVGWQLDHALRVIIGVIKMLKASDPKQYKWKFSLSKIYIMSRGVIPRGVGKAPKSVRSKQQEFEMSYLEELVLAAKEELRDLDSIHSKAFFEHPYFGKMKKKETLKFIGIHTEHHLKIMRDILK